MKLSIYLLVYLIYLATPMATDILFEGFESGSLPSGWQVWEEGDYTSSWIFDDTDYPYTGNYAAFRPKGLYFYSDWMGDDSWLVTPTLNLSCYENIEFSCYCIGIEEDWPPVITIEGSEIPDPQFGGDFLMIEYIGSPEYSWEHIVVDAWFCDGQPHVTFAIRYKVYRPAEEGYYDAIYIDDVLITGDPIEPVESASLGGIKAIYK